MQRRYVIPVAMAIFAPIWGVVALTGEPAPHIVFETDAINVGDVVHGHDAVATFTYKNTGDAPLHILSAKPACGCTVASFDQLIPAGTSGTVKASVHTISFKGQIAKQITVNHDDKSRGPVQLNVMANVVGSVDILPYPSLQLARKRRGFGTPAQLIVRQDPTEKGRLALGELTASAKWLKLSFREIKADEPPTEMIPAAKTGDVIVSILADPDTPVGNHNEKISFTTGLKREPKVTVPVTAYVQGPLTLEPAELILNPAPGGKGGARGQVLVALRDDIDPHSLTVRSESSAFSVRLDPSGGLALRVLVDWSGKGKNPPLATVIHLRTGKDKVDLPVRVAPSS